MPNRALQFLTAALLLQGIVACNEKPFTKHKLKARRVIGERVTPAKKNLTEDPTAESKPTESQSNPESIVDQGNEPDQKIKPQNPTEHLLCRKLLQTLKSEPKFYALQAKMRRYRADRIHGRMMLATMRRLNLTTDKGKLPAQTSNVAPFRNCVDILLTFDRFQNLEIVNKAQEWDATRMLAAQLEKSRARYMEFPLQNCTEILASLDKRTDYDILKRELRSAPRLSPEEVMLALLEAQPTVKKIYSDIKITAKGCLRAFNSFPSYYRIKQFSKAPATDQINMIGSFGSF